MVAGSHDRVLTRLARVSRTRRSQLLGDAPARASLSAGVAHRRRSECAWPCMSGRRDSAFPLSPLRMRCEVGLERGSVFTQAVAVRAAAVVGILELHRIVLPSADATDLVGSRRFLVER